MARLLCRRRWPTKIAGEEGSLGSVDQLAKERRGRKEARPCSGQQTVTSAVRPAKHVANCQREVQARGARPEVEARVERPSRVTRRTGLGRPVAPSKEGRIWARSEARWRREARVNEAEARRRRRGEENRSSRYS